MEMEKFVKVAQGEFRTELKNWKDLNCTTTQAMKAGVANLSMFPGVLLPNHCWACNRWTVVEENYTTSVFLSVLIIFYV